MLDILQFAGWCSTMNCSMYYMAFGCLPDIYVGEKPVYNQQRLEPNSIFHLNTKCFCIVFHILIVINTTHQYQSALVLVSFTMIYV